MTPVNCQVIADKRGHETVRKLLADIITKTDILQQADFSFSDMSDRSYLVELKEIGDLLGSISSGRLYEQVRAMSNTGAVCFLIYQGYFSPGQDGKVYMAQGHPTNWKFSSVMGILIDIALKGVIPIHTHNDYATALTIRTLVTQVNTQKRAEIRTPKVFGFRPKESDQLRVVASLPGINIQFARVLLQRFHTVRRIMSATEDELMSCPGIGQARAQRITGVLEVWES